MPTTTPRLTPTQARFLDALAHDPHMSYFAGRVRVTLRVEGTRSVFEVPQATVWKLRDLGLIVADASGIRLAVSA